jgi:hypothetical protein
VLAPARGALDERRRVGTDASALNTLAGARGGTVGTTLRKHEQMVRFLVVRNAIPQKSKSLTSKRRSASSSSRSRQMTPA